MHGHLTFSFSLILAFLPPNIPLVFEDRMPEGKGELALLAITLAPLQWLKKFLNCSDKVVLQTSSPHSSMLCTR